MRPFMFLSGGGSKWAAIYYLVSVMVGTVELDYSRRGGETYLVLPLSSHSALGGGCPAQQE